MNRTRMINDILRRDPSPPQGMAADPYRRWLRSLHTDDLADYHRVIKKHHEPKTKIMKHKHPLERKINPAKRTVIILIGEAGCGKTTLGWRLCTDPKTGCCLDLEEIAIAPRGNCTKAGLRESFAKIPRLVICVQDLGARKNSSALLEVLELLAPDETFVWNLSRVGGGLPDAALKNHPLKKYLRLKLD